LEKEKISLMNIGENVVIWISDFPYHEIGSQWNGQVNY